MTKKKEKEEDVIEQKDAEKEVEAEVGKIESEKEMAAADKKAHEELVKTAEEYLNNWKRTQADFENYKKDQARMMGEFRKFAALDMIMQILPVLDNFNASLEHVPEDQKDNAWVIGINYIQKQLEDVLKNNGVSEIETKVGDKFDPSLHEAVDTKEINSDMKETNKIIKIVQKGYKIDGKVIRAVKVVVA